MPSCSDSGSIPVDEQFILQQDDDAKTFSSGRTMATTTTMYRHENGRTYHAFRDGEYWQPNDAQQNNHEGIVHHICILTLRDALFVSPIQKPKRVLDLGTGTGIWATDMADRYPEADVIGIDLSPIQPSMQPPNCHFEIDDCTSHWVYPDNHFDFIHIRGLFGSISDWPALYTSIYQHLEPGGYFEQMEWSIHVKTQNASLPKEHPMLVWGERGVEISKRIGKSFEIAEEMSGLIDKAGFTDIVEKRFKWPIGPWSSDSRLKEIGRWNLLNWEQGMEGWTLAGYTRVLGWTYQQVQDYLKQVRSCLRSRKSYMYHEVRVVYARKPS